MQVGQLTGQLLHVPSYETFAKYWLDLHTVQFVAYRRHSTQVTSHFLAKASLDLVL
jgi:hypothetical protein